MSIKSFLGLQSQAEKIKEYKELLFKSDQVIKSIDQLAENYSVQKAQYDDLSISQDEELREKGLTRFNVFMKQQVEDISILYKKKTSIEKSIKKLENEAEIADTLKEIKQLFDVRQMWKKGLIKKAIYSNLLKSKNGGIVRYADILLMDTEGRLLILQRAGEEGSATTKWCVPGGHVDPGESFKEAAIRELYEETGFDLSHEKRELTEVAIFKNSEIEIHYFMAHLTSSSHTTVVVDAFEEVGSEWIDPSSIDDFDFIFDMKDNLKKILGLEISENKFTTILKAFNEGQISESIFKSFCDKNPDEIRKAKNKTYFSHKERKDLAEKGEAMPNGKYPIRNSQDLRDAIRLVGASDMPESEVKVWIRKRAKALGLEKELPGDWKKKVEKAEGIEDAQILSKESLDGEVKNVVRTEDGPDDTKIEKARTCSKVITIECDDKEGSLEELLNTIKKIGNGGHSFSIVIDPDLSEQNGGNIKIGWDGDGSDYIGDIKVKEKDSSIEKSISFTRKVYDESTMKEVEDTPSKYKYGQFMMNFSSNEGNSGEEFGDFLATLSKVSNLGKPYSVKLNTTDNGNQEWKWTGKDFRLDGIIRTENLCKSSEEDLHKVLTEVEKSQEGFQIGIKFNDLEEAQLFKSFVEDLNNRGKINAISIEEMSNPFEKSLDKDKKIFNSYLNFIEGIKTRLKNIHWGEEDNSKHIYLDDLSEEVAEFEDKIAEAGQSGFGRFKDREIQGDKIEESDPVKICQLLFDRTAEFRKELENEDIYDGEISWIDDFLAKLKQSKYRLQMH